ncbi:transcriptional regulator with XRE-family HTH domain [Paenibacillus sp. PastF-3]|uniref:helix-turn-helix domain-containing protein n=1 Tax=Paenibacillus sp. PastF-3 TaxID=2940626 RepID=UPI002473D9C5|nr:helix-turn-helix transcriptional regulator [Paenibacillus sp. PastF-3]MDH6370584.1 transcriptional regulator with XRE-family HTH domain [Paenibacillus sp. PastF-3]
MSISGDRIRQLRETRNLSQIELANRIGINNSVLSRIESGRRPVADSEINSFADFFDVSGDYLLGRTNKKGSALDNGELEKKEQAEFEAFINNPEHGIFFRDYLSAPEERREEMREIFKILQDKERGRKPGDIQGEN